jgi:hypothetical protein
MRTLQVVVAVNLGNDLMVAVAEANALRAAQAQPLLQWWPGQGSMQ